MRFFNRKNEEIENLKEKVIILEDRCKNLKQEHEKLKEKVSKLIGLYEPQYVSVNNTVPRGKDKKPRRKSPHGSNIKTFARYNEYRQTRHYDEINDCFYTKMGAKNKMINMNFMQLIEIITSYQKGLTVKEISKKPLLKSLLSSDGRHERIRQYIYIYRAGGFNDAIKKYAPKKGYNPDKLISNEV